MSPTPPRPEPVLTTDAARATMAWAGGILLLSVAAMAVGGLMAWLAPASGAFNIVAFVPMIVVAMFASRGRSWARILLMALTGIQAVNVAGSGALTHPGLGTVVMLAYLTGVVICLAGLFREPAAAHFRRR